MGKRSRRRGEPDGGTETAAPPPAVAAEQHESAAEAAAEPPAAPAEAGDGAPANGSGAEDAAKRQPGRGGAPQGDLRLREALNYVEEADMLLALFRWTVLTGEPPRPEDWLPREDWPHPDAIANVFGSWTKFVEYSGLREAPPLLRKRSQDERESRLDGRERQLEREERRAADMRRQLEVARRRRAEAEALRDEHERRVAGLERRLSDAEHRAEDAERRMAERREQAERAATEHTGAAGEPSDEWLRAHEAALAELDQVRAHRDELLRSTEALESEAGRQRDAIAELSALLGGAGEEGGDAAADAGAAGEPEEAPKSVLEAVRVAREALPHLVFTEAADESAADSPFRRPQEILDVLRRLDRLAELYADPAGFGASLGQAAQEQGLNWRPGVSELARNRFPNAYTITHDGHRLELGPHVAIGSGSGAGFVARVYLHVADGTGDVPRGVYVGHVGRHLPDTTT